MDDCPICVDEIQKDDYIQLPCCKLDLHQSCHDYWVETRYNNKCLHCRREYVPDIFYDAEEEPKCNKEQKNSNFLRIMGGMGGLCFSN